jgi:hypothetical protein
MFPEAWSLLAFKISVADKAFLRSLLAKMPAWGGPHMALLISKYVEDFVLQGILFDYTQGRRVKRICMYLYLSSGAER